MGLLKSNSAKSNVDEHACLYLREPNYKPTVSDLVEAYTSSVQMGLGAADIKEIKEKEINSRVSARQARSAGCDDHSRPNLTMSGM